MAPAKNGNSEPQQEEAWTTWLRQPDQLSEEELKTLRQRFPLDSRSYLVALLRAVIQGNLDALPPCYLFRVGPAWRRYLFLWREWESIRNAANTLKPSFPEPVCSHPIPHHAEETKEKARSGVPVEPLTDSPAPDAEEPAGSVEEHHAFSKEEPRTFVEWLVALQQQRHQTSGQEASRTSPLLASHTELQRVKALIRELSPHKGDDEQKGSDKERTPSD